MDATTTTIRRKERRMSELDFMFIDAVIAGDMELAYKIALEYEQGEQISFLGEKNG